MQYFHRAKRLETCFKSFRLRHVPRSENNRADLLSKLASGNVKGGLSTVIRQVPTKPTVECFSVTASGTHKDWKNEIIQMIQRQDEGQALSVEKAKQIARYCLMGDDLYRRGYVTPLLKCLVEGEIEYVMRELHEGVCGRHTGGRTLQARVLRAGFFWPTLEKDCMMFT